MRKQTKIAALVSAAALLAIGASMTSFAAGWTTQDGYSVYLDGDGYPVTDSFKKWVNPYNASDPSNGKWCYLDGEGHCVRNQLVEDNGHYYYIGDDYFRVENAWKALDNENADEVNGVIPDVIWYYLDATNGRAVMNTDKQITDQKYRFDEYGRMIIGWWEDSNGNWWYYNDTVDDQDHLYGAAADGWVKMAPNPQNLPDNEELPTDQDADEVYYFFEKGKMFTGSKYANKRWYYMNAKGILVTSGWTQITGKDANKNLGTTTASDAYVYANADGKKLTGWQYITWKDDSSANWFYLDKYGVRFQGTAGKATGSDGKEISVGAMKIKEKYYLFDEEGRMLYGLYEIGGTGFTAERSSFEFESGKLYFFDDGDNSQGKNGWMIVNAKKAIGDGFDNETNYYFDKKGQAYTNTVVGGAYYDGDGVRHDAIDGDWEEIDLSDATEIYASGNKKYTALAGTSILVNGKGVAKYSGYVRNVSGYQTYYVGKLPTETEIKTALKNGQTINLNYVYGTAGDMNVYSMSSGTEEAYAAKAKEISNNAKKEIENTTLTAYNVFAVIE